MEYAKSIIDWSKSIGIKEIIVLSSADAAFRTDALLEGLIYYSAEANFLGLNFGSKAK
jgi:hypothetical protein